eukprot:595960-Rhodomonas_salina.1
MKRLLCGETADRPYNRLECSFDLFVFVCVGNAQVLFNDVALNNLKLIASAGQFRTYAASSAYFLR